MHEACVIEQRHLRESIDELSRRLSDTRATDMELLRSGMTDVDVRIELRVKHIHNLLEARTALYDSKERALYAAVQSVRDSSSAALLCAEHAILKSDISTEKRFDGVNEFRSTLSDQQRTLMPRAEVEVLFRGISKQLEDQNTLIAAQNVRMVGMTAQISGTKEGLMNGWGFAVGVIGIVIGIVSFILRTR